MPQAAGTAIITDENIKRLRALEMIQMRMVGMTFEQIGEHFKCDRETVSKTIKWAGKVGIIDTAENQILTNLVPKAIKVYETALDNGDTFAAKHVLDKLADMAERADRRRDKGEDRMLEMWLREREEKKKRADKSGKTEGDAVASELVEGDANVIDAEVVPEEARESDGEDGKGESSGNEPPFFQASTLVE